MKDPKLSDDEHCHLPLLFGRVLDGQGGARALDWEEAQRWQPGHAGEVLWIHLLRARTGLIDWLQQALAISEPTAELLTSDESRPRAFAEGDALIATLRGINFNPGAAPEDMLSIHLWSDGNQVVTLRRAPLQTPGLVCNDLDAGKGPVVAGSLVMSVAEHLIDRMSHATVDTNAMIDELEAETWDTWSDQTLDRIATIRRNCLSLKRHMSPQHEALMAISHDAPAWFEDHDRREIAESIARLRRYLDDLDISKESALVLQDDIRARAAANTQRTQYVLAIVAGIFLPLTFITGLLGINVGDIPLAQDGSHGFRIIAGLCGTLLGVEVLLLRRLRWF